jgi:dynein heavy chain
MKIINIITIDVHGRDIVEKYVLEKIQDPDSFKWLSQLKFVYENKMDSDMHLRQNMRFPWEKDRVKKKCIIRIVDWFRFYSYEYVGNAMRLVVTPLTDRCYITLT